MTEYCISSIIKITPYLKMLRLISQNSVLFKSRVSGAKFLEFTSGSPLFTGSLTLGKLVNLSVLQFPYLYTQVSDHHV